MTKQTIKALFIDRYAELRNRLSFHLGSDDLAEDVLQETWLRVDQMGDVASVHNPLGYLFRIALNIAADQRRAESRLLYYNEIEELMQSTDDALSPASAASALQDVEQLQHALRRLPPRRRTILLAARVEGATQREIAARLGLSTRMIEKELKAALLFCGDAIGRDVIQQFGPGAGKPSTWVGQATSGSPRQALRDDDETAQHDERD